MRGHFTLHLAVPSHNHCHSWTKNPNIKIRNDFVMLFIRRAKWLAITQACRRNECVRKSHSIAQKKLIHKRTSQIRHPRSNWQDGNFHRRNCFFKCAKFLLVSHSLHKFHIRYDRNAERYGAHYNFPSIFVATKKPNQNISIDNQKILPSRKRRTVSHGEGSSPRSFQSPNNFSSSKVFLSIISMRTLHPSNFCKSCSATIELPLTYP